MFALHCFSVYLVSYILRSFSPPSKFSKWQTSRLKTRDSDLKIFHVFSCHPGEGTVDTPNIYGASIAFFADSERQSPLATPRSSKTTQRLFGRVNSTGKIGWDVLVGQGSLSYTRFWGNPTSSKCCWLF